MKCRKCPASHVTSYDVVISHLMAHAFNPFNRHSPLVNSSLSHHGPFRSRLINNASKSKASDRLLRSLAHVLPLIARCLSHPLHSATCRRRTSLAAASIRSAQVSGSRFEFQSTNQGACRDGAVCVEVGFFFVARGGDKIDVVAERE